MTVEQYIEEHLMQGLMQTFGKIDFKGRLVVNQDDGFYFIEFDNEMVCVVADDITQGQLDKEFYQGFLDLYKSEMIYLNKELYEEKEREREQDEIIKKEAKKAERKKDLERLSTEEKEIANIVLDEVEKDETAQ